MNIKIKCTAVEYAALVRDCMYSEMQKQCGDCFLRNMTDPDKSCAGIETLVDVEIVEDGAGHG